MRSPEKRTGPGVAHPEARSQRVIRDDEAGAIIASRIDKSGVRAGAALRDEGAADEAACVDWRATVDGAAALVTNGEPFTADDLRELLRGLPEAASANAWGARLLNWARTGEIVRVGHTWSRRRAAHRRVLTVWRGAA